MKDALGNVQSVLVLGGTSEIALSSVEALSAQKLARVVLAGRSLDRLEEAAKRLRMNGVHNVVTTIFDAEDTESHEAVIKSVFDEGDIDVAILGFGILIPQEQVEEHPLKAVEMVTVNYTGAVSAGLILAEHMNRQGHGTLVVLSSVAGMRARKSNYVYGSTKAGIDFFAKGLSSALAGTGVRVLIVRPGFVKTAMTSGMKPAPLSIDSGQAGRTIAEAILSGKDLVYAPWVLRPVMAGLKSLPESVFRRLNM